MKKNILIYGLLLSALSMSSLNNSCSSEGSTAAENAEELIRINRLMNNVIIVSLGSDAMTAINTRDGIVVIDAGISNSLTAVYRRIIEKEFRRTDFAYLINTHSHWDHTGGNQVFLDAVIIGQENCISEISEYWKEKEKIKHGVKKIIDDYDNKLLNFDPDWQDSTEIYSQKLKYQYVLNDLVNDRIVTVPTKTFKDSMTISIGDITLEMIYSGRAHSESDILIYIPELKLLFTGDLISAGRKKNSYPDEKSESVRGITVKKWIERRINNIGSVVRGHGEIIDKGRVKPFLRYSINF